MTDQAGWASLAEGLTQIGRQVVSYMPQLLAAVAILLVGWLLAKALRAVSLRLVRGLDYLWHRLILRTGLEQLQPRHPPAHIAGELVFWLVILVFVAVATQVLGLELFTNWLAQLGAYLPMLVTGLLIILAGVIVSALARDLVAAAVSSAGLSQGQGELLGRTTQVMILLSAVVIGVQQIGIDVGFVTVVLGIALAAILGGIGLAFGIGARTHVSNVLAARQVRQLYGTGDRIRVGGVEGRIVELTTAMILVETDEGRAAVPARLLSEEISVLTGPTRRHRSST